MKQQEQHNEEPKSERVMSRRSSNLSRSTVKPRGAPVESNDTNQTDLAVEKVLSKEEKKKLKKERRTQKKEESKI